MVITDGVIRVFHGVKVYIFNGLNQVSDMLSERFAFCPSTYATAQLIDSIKPPVRDFQTSNAVKRLKVSHIRRIPSLDFNTIVIFLLKYTPS